MEELKPFWTTWKEEDIEKAKDILKRAFHLQPNEPSEAFAWRVLDSFTMLSKENSLNAKWQRTLAERNALLIRKWLDVKSLVATQAEDRGLWFIAERASEEYLQAALRQLHDKIEKTLEELENPNQTE